MSADRRFRFSALKLLWTPFWQRRHWHGSSFMPAIVWIFKGAARSGVFRPQRIPQGAAMLWGGCRRNFTSRLLNQRRSALSLS